MSTHSRLNRNITQIISKEKGSQPHARTSSLQTFLMSVGETLIGVAIILALGAIVPGQGWGLLNLHPHPLWIVPIGIAVRYGARSGYMAGGVAALAFTMLIIMRPDGQARLFAADLIQPFLMFVAGSVVGEVVDAREQRLADVSARGTEMEQLLATLWRRHEIVEAARLALEKELAFQQNSTVTLANIGQKLQSLHVAELHTALVDLLCMALEADACALYLLDGGRLALESASPSTHSPQPTIVIAADSLISRAIMEGRVVSIKDQLVGRGVEDVDRDAPLMAGPLVLHDGEIYGVIVIESLPFSALTSTVERRLEIILRWASAALENALSFEIAISCNQGQADKWYAPKSDAEIAR